MTRSNRHRLSLDFSDCRCCPRNCGVDRASEKLGFCKAGVGMMIGTICAHRGEEPVISGARGVCNIFFDHCNMQCIYCQNYEISTNTRPHPEALTALPELVEHIEQYLERGLTGVGFVSPSHYLPQMIEVIETLRAKGHKPVFIYNTNGYDRREAIAMLAEYIDVYLPDFKYADERLAREFSDAPHYPEIAAAAIGEMFRQVGADIELDEEGLITRGMIIRHLVLPGQVENSKAVLRHIAEHYSPDCHISLMAQYWPIPRVRNHPTLSRHLTPEEYQDVLDEFEQLGFHRGWVQQLSSADYYRPHFMQENPFEG